MLKRSLHVQLETKWATILFIFLKSWNWELTFTDILFGLHPKSESVKKCSKTPHFHTIFVFIYQQKIRETFENYTTLFLQKSEVRQFKMVENMPYGNIFRPTATRTNYDHYLYGESLFSTVPVSSIVHVKRLILIF